MLTGPVGFLADVHLGKLAKMLRMLGIDTKYRNDFTNTQLIQIAEAEKRILLSRNSAFAKNASVTFFWIESEKPHQQLKQVMERFELQESFHPFSRCLTCNGILKPQQKEMIDAGLEENTRKFYQEFWQCSSCGKVYWKGSHYQRMQKLLKTLELG